jgi:hypothetical protein
LTPRIPKRKNIRMQNNNKLKMLGIDFIKEFIAILSPSDLEMILNGLMTLATLKVFRDFTY